MRKRSVTSNALAIPTSQHAEQDAGPGFAGATRSGPRRVYESLSCVLSTSIATHQLCTADARWTIGRHRQACAEILTSDGRFGLYRREPPMSGSFIIASDTRRPSVTWHVHPAPPNRPSSIIPCSAQPRCSSSMPAQTEPMTIFRCTFR
jgi:hypothetical protein